MSEPHPVLAAVTSGTHVLGTSLIGLGVLAALSPGLTGAPVVILVGLLLAIAGVVRAAFGWRAWSAGKGPLGVLIGGRRVGTGVSALRSRIGA